MIRRLRILALFILFFCQYYNAYSQEWTEETARQEAFANIKQNIDISAYAIKDRNYEENQEALREKKEKIANRFVTPNPEPPVSYVVSELNEKGTTTITTFFGKEGTPLFIRIFSRAEYPRAGYIYCVTDFTDINGKALKAGELLSVHFQLSDGEAFYFDPKGKCTYHAKF